jgi:hypothetical protein
MSRRIRFLTFVAGLALLALLVLRVGGGPRALAADVRRVGWGFAPIVALWGVVYAMNTASWLLVLHASEVGARLPFARAYAISVSSFALNYVTPVVALGGEALRTAAVAPLVGRQRAAAATVAFRVVHTSGQLLCWLLTVPLALALLPTTTAMRIVLVLAALVLLAATTLLGAALRARTLERLLDALPRIPLLARAAPRLERHRAALLGVDAEIAAVAHDRPRRLAAALAIETASRFVATLEFVLIARGIGAPMGFAGGAVVAGFSQVVMNALFFLPFEVGAKEGSLFVIFRALGYSAHVAVSSAVLSRLRELAWIAIGLGLIWVGAERRTALGARR